MESEPLPILSFSRFFSLSLLGCALVGTAAAAEVAPELLSSEANPTSSSVSSDFTSSEVLPNNEHEKCSNEHEEHDDHENCSEHTEEEDKHIGHEHNEHKPDDHDSHHHHNSSPNLSLVVTSGGQLGGSQDSDRKNSLFIQEVELQFSAPLTSYAQIKATAGAHNGESPELEEAFLHYTGKDGPLQLRIGKMRQELGALNSVHTHALPQADRPLLYSEFLGDDGLSTTGAELSWRLPVAWHSKATFSVSSRVGTHSHHHDDSEDEGEFAIFPNEGKQHPIFCARWENRANLNERTSLSLGLSHASSHIDSEHIRSSALNGADLTLKWKPCPDSYREFTWRSEYMNAHQVYTTHGDIDHLSKAKHEHNHHEHDLKDKNLNGWYTYLAYRPHKNFRFGLRYDQADSAAIEKGVTRRTSAFAEYIASEWNSLKLQYNRTSPSWQSGYNELLLQWNVIVGPRCDHNHDH